MYFLADGTALPGGSGASGGLLLSKPDFSAAEGITTTFPAGSDLAVFRGTSAAAPHAAAIAALALSLDPSMTPARLRYVLTEFCAAERCQAVE